MSLRWRNILLQVTAVTVLFYACTKKPTPNPDPPLPTTYYPSIIINSDNQIVYALDPKTGKKNWELSLPSLNGSPNVEYTPSPLVYRGSVYMTCLNSDTVYKINALTGKLTAKYNVAPTNTFGFKATPIADGGLLYLAATDGTLYVMDTGDNHVSWSFSTTGPLVSSPVIYKGQVYIASTTGHVYSLDKVNGPDINGYPTWDWPGRDNTGATIDSGARFVSSPSIADPYLYLGSISDSNMYCIYLDQKYESSPGSSYWNGIKRWKYKTKGAIYSSPACLAGRCIFGSNDHHIYCLDTSLDILNGKLSPSPIWIDSALSEVISSPTISNQIVYVGSKDYNLYAFGIKNGDLKWQFKTYGLIKASPLAYGGMVYIASYDKNLYGVDSATGTMKWSQPINGAIECSPAIDDLKGGHGVNSTMSGYSRIPQ